MVARRFVLLGMLAGGVMPMAGGAAAEAPSRSLRPMSRSTAALAARPLVPPTTAALIAAAKLGAAQISYVVMDAQSGAVLEGEAAGVMLPPASVAKAVTALYALERLGPMFRYRTRVVATGPLRDGVVQGDLVLVGDGDPTLQTDDLGDLAQRLAQAGVRGVKGRFLLWQGALPKLRQISDEQPVQVGYNPALSGLNLNFNRVHFEWRRANGAWAVTMDARGARFVPPVQLTKMRVVERETPIFGYASGDAHEEWTVAAKALGKGGSRWLPVRQPALYAGEVFQTLAAAQGIRLGAPTLVEERPTGQELAFVESAYLPEILRDMLRFSTNITAEAVGLRASGAADLASSAQAMSAWVAATFGGTSRWVDHSGLGGASRVAAADMAAILRRARQSGLQPLLRNQGLRNAKGEEIKTSAVRVMAKSGTLNFVSGLAGYVVPPSGDAGRELVFAISIGDVARRDRLGMAEREAPAGGDAWTRRARHLQHQLISRWSVLYGTVTSQ